MKWIVGVDEAGRGPLAGPVSVGVVSIPIKTKLLLEGLTDSKKLSEKKREEWFQKIQEWNREGKLQYAVSLVSSSIIDKKGIVFAINLGMSRCVRKLGVKPKQTLVLLDGSLHAPKEFLHQRTIIKGDEKISVISLASIVAKVTRDRYMVKLAMKYPEYAFDVHKGYGTLIHRMAIKKSGISKIHRKTFLRNI
jgi:ribonuclease HII